MKVLKFTMVLAMLLSIGTFAMAQSNYSEYLDLAMEKLKAGDCESAQKFYNVYRELSGEQKPSVQVLIDDCKKSKQNLRSVGDKIYVNGKNYIVVYLSDEGKHGYAVCDDGKSALSKKLIDDRLVPSTNELLKIRENKEIIGVFDRCWSYNYHSYDVGDRYKFVDFNSGYVGYDYKPKKYRILLIYRF